MISRKLKIICVIALSQYHVVASTMPLAQGFNLLTMLESTTSALTTLGDYSALNPDGHTDGTDRIGSSGISWEGSYSNSGWSYSATGIFGDTPLSMNYTGNLSGGDGSDIIISFLGGGSFGASPLAMSGSAEWLFDNVTNQYSSMLFSQETKIGAGSWFGWLRAFEYVGGATVGTLAGIGAGIGTTVTGPGAVVIGVATGATVGIGATAGLITISNTIKSDLTPVSTLPPPVPPPPAEPFEPSTQVALATSNVLISDDMSNKYKAIGSYSDGVFSGSTMNVPEPKVVWLIFLALIISFVSSMITRRKCSTNAPISTQ